MCHSTFGTSPPRTPRCGRCCFWSTGEPGVAAKRAVRRKPLGGVGPRPGLKKTHRKMMENYDLFFFVWPYMFHFFWGGWFSTMFVSWFSPIRLVVESSTTSMVPIKSPMTWYDIWKASARSSPDHIPTTSPPSSNSFLSYPRYITEWPTSTSTRTLTHYSLMVCSPTISTVNLRKSAA